MKTGHYLGERKVIYHCLQSVERSNLLVQFLVGIRFSTMIYAFYVCTVFNRTGTGHLIRWDSTNYTPVWYIIINFKMKTLTSMLVSVS